MLSTKLLFAGRFASSIKRIAVGTQSGLYTQASNDGGAQVERIKDEADHRVNWVCRFNDRNELDMPFIR